MKLPWVVVSTEGLDAEEVERPRTQELECPACDRHVRFVEKQLVRNLKVFGVPLLGVERGRRVLECPSCRACIEPIEGMNEEPDDEVRARARASLQQARDEHWLWKRRAEMAVERGDDDLAAEALRMARRAELEVSRLESELGRAGAARRDEGATSRARGDEREGARKPAVVARPSPQGGVVESHDDAFAALKAKVAERERAASEREQGAYAARMAELDEAQRLREAQARQADEEEAARGALSSSSAERAAALVVDERAVDDEFAALKAKLGSRGTTSASDHPAEAGEARGSADVDDTAALKAKLAAVSSPASPSSLVAGEPAREPVVASAPSAKASDASPVQPSFDDEFAALRAKVAARAAGASGAPAPSDRAAYEALQRELREPPPEPEAPSNAAAAGAPARAEPHDEDDLVAALKRKLRGGK